jgi:hypothetical protein
MIKTVFRVQSLTNVLVSNLFDNDWSKNVQVETIFADGGIRIPLLGTTKVSEKIVSGLHTGVR